MNTPVNHPAHRDLIRCHVCTTPYQVHLDDCPACAGLVQCACGVWMLPTAEAKAAHVCAEAGGDR